MQSGKCPICGEYTGFFLKPHRCPPQWRVRVAEDSEYYDGDEAVEIYGRDAEQAAEKFAEQWDYDDMLMGQKLDVEVTAAGDPDTVQKFTVSGELVPRYWARPAEDKE